VTFTYKVKENIDTDGEYQFTVNPALHYVACELLAKDVHTIALAVAFTGITKPAQLD